MGDPEVDPGARWGLEKPKNQSAQNIFKMDLYAGHDVTNPTQLEWEKIDDYTVCTVPCGS